MQCDAAKVFDAAANIQCGTKYLCWLYNHSGKQNLARTLGKFKSGPRLPPDQQYAKGVQKCERCFAAGGDCDKCDPYKNRKK